MSRKYKKVNYNKNKNKNSIHIKIDNSRKTNYKKSNSQPSRSHPFHFISQPTPAQQQPIILNIPGFNPIPNTGPIPTGPIPTGPIPTGPITRPITRPIIRPEPQPSLDEIRSDRVSILKTGGVTPPRSIGEKKMETPPPLEKVPTTPLKTSGVDETPSIGAMDVFNQRIRVNSKNEKENIIRVLNDYGYRVDHSVPIETLRGMYDDAYEYSKRITEKGLDPEKEFERIENERTKLINQITNLGGTLRGDPRNDYSIKDLKKIRANLRKVTTPSSVRKRDRKPSDRYSP
jgi:hypothetical protein